MIQISNGKNPIQGYLAPSETGAGPGVIVIQEWWGLVDHIRDVADRLARAGFTALAPDLYEGKPAEEPDEAASLMQALNIAKAEQTLADAVKTLAANPSTAPNDRIGVVGFCMGGQLALYAGCANPLIKATVDFYGIHPNVTAKLDSLSGPVLGFFAENDSYASPEVVGALSKELDALDKQHTFKTYPGTHHAFFNDSRPSVYDSVAAEDAWSRMLIFFKKELS